MSEAYNKVKHDNLDKVLHYIAFNNRNHLFDFWVDQIEAALRAAREGSLGPKEDATCPTEPVVAKTSGRKRILNQYAPNSWARR